MDGSGGDSGRVRAINLLGALSFSVAQRVRSELARRLGRAADEVAALAVVDEMPCSIDWLARVAGLTHSGTVRMVDRLERAGLLRRDRDPDDGRAVLLTVTAAGRDFAAAARQIRLELLETLVEQVPTDGLLALGEAAGTVLAPLATDLAAGWRICCLCDAGACKTGGRCPVAVAVQRVTGWERQHA